MKKTLKYAVVRDAQLQYSDEDFLELLLTCKNRKAAKICKKALEKKERRSGIGYYVCKTEDFLKDRLCFVPTGDGLNGLSFELVTKEDCKTQ